MNIVNQESQSSRADESSSSDSQNSQGFESANKNDLDSNRKKSRRRFSFSLGTFCIFVLGVGAFLGYWVVQVEPIRRQWKDAKPFLRVQGVQIQTASSGLPTWVTRFLPADKREYIESIGWGSDLIEKGQFEAIGKMPRLESLALTGLALNDEHCVTIAKIKTLKNLDLKNNQITDVGAKLLADLPSLNSVDLKSNYTTWRTSLFYQENSEALLQSNYAGNVINPVNGDFDGLARLNVPPVQSVRLSSFSSDENIRQIAGSLPKLEKLEILNPVSIPEYSFETLKTVQKQHRFQIRFWSMAMRRSPTVSPAFKRVWSTWGSISHKVEARGNDVNSSFEFYVQDEAGETSVRFSADSHRMPNRKDYELLDPLKSVTEFEMSGFVPGECAILGKFPSLQNLSLFGLREIPDSLNGDISQLTKLEDLMITPVGNQFSRTQAGYWPGVRSRELKWPQVFFENWSSYKTLANVRIESSSVTREQLFPLLAFPNLKTLSLDTERFVVVKDDSPVGKPHGHNYLPEFRRRFGLDDKGQQIKVEDALFRQK